MKLKIQFTMEVAFGDEKLLARKARELGAAQEGDTDREAIARGFRMFGKEFIAIAGASRDTHAVA